MGCIPGLHEKYFAVMPKLGLPIPKSWIMDSLLALHTTCSVKSSFILLQRLGTVGIVGMAVDVIY